MPIPNAAPQPQVPDPMKKPSSMLVHWLIFLVIVVVVVGGAWFFRADLGLDTLLNKISNVSLLNSNTNSGSTIAMPTSIAEELDAQSKLKKFASLDEVSAFLDSRAASSSSMYYGMETRNAIDATEQMPTSAPVFGLGQADLKSTPDYSTTNVQVAGVDEADIVKTDGETIYAVAKQNVYLIDANPAKDAKILSTIALDSTPQEIYINKNKLVIYGTDYGNTIRPLVETIRPSSSYAYVKIFDVTDKTNPKQLRSLDFEGTIANTRMINDVVYFVTTQSTYQIDDEYPIPLMIDNGKVLPTSAEAGNPCNCPDIWYIDSPYGNYSFTTVSAIDLTDATKAVTNSAYLMGAGQNLYVSQENMYIVYTKYISEQTLTLEVTKALLLPKLSEKDKARIAEIDAVSTNVLSREEKLQKMMVIFQRYANRLSEPEQEKLSTQITNEIKKKYQDISKELEKSVIHKIALSGTKLTYKGSGEVTGQVLNQFSMDESGGYFRIATTKSQTWSQFADSTKSYNNLYILDKDLKVVGKVENLAEGEQIYSVRFMQNRAYLVTFRQTDPLFVIDVKDPTAPKVLGQLKVPGYSAYLHPYNDTLLIGLGKDADANGRVKGVKLSLFDVSDVNNLKEVDTYSIGDSGSDSIALNEHKAFLFDKDKQLLVVPITMREVLATSKYGSVSTNGAFVFKITESGFEFRDIIKHTDGATDDSTSTNYYGVDYYASTVKRSLYIGDVLYTLSDKYLKSNALSDLAPIKQLKLAPGSTSDDYTIIR